ncbi:STAS domain-containing protein [Saccharothrix sp. S26]|uniref:STAS domain-containing protein n=1 Tax=Saccharothrix sp. S26 TaxID=2907215 RepID=UPI001F490D6C|nr:STAS domain-containing protein [Saccharothrix sp. S26]MCE6998098.1 STAS domain-containing protein [Saccharothrix sp. S26]
MSLHIAGDDVVVSLKRLGSASVLVVRGCVDAGTAQVLRERVDLASRGPGGVVVDLSEVSFFSSAGAAALASASRRVRLHVVVTPVVRRVLEAAGVADVLDLHDFPAAAEEAATASRPSPLLLVG